MMSTIYIDIEGFPVRELAALYINESHQIVDVFHDFANAAPGDSDVSVHGLPPTIPNACANQDELLCKFKVWLSEHPYSCMYANDPHLEQHLLHLDVKDLRLPLWKDRMTSFSHCVAVLAKRIHYDIMGHSCSCHTMFQMLSPKRFPINLGIMARSLFGHHCALYDCLELYLYSK